MAIRMAWGDDAHTVMIHEYSGQWTWSDLYASWTDNVKAIESVPHKVGILVDLTDSTTMLPSGALPNTRNLIRQIPSNVALVVVVGAQSVFQTIYSAVTKAYGSSRTPVMFIETVEEARRLLQAQGFSMPSF